MAKKETTYNDILTQLRNKEYKPVYLLMGEEAFYIDKISDYIENNVLTEEEKGFNLTILYGDQATPTQVAQLCKSFPMVGNRQVVIVKEAQNMFNKKKGGDAGSDSDGGKSDDALIYYLQQPQPQTILVMCYKYGKMDSRKKLFKEISQTGIVYTSEKIRDYNLPKWIESYVREEKMSIDMESAMILADYIGADLTRMASNIDRLKLSMPEGANRITPELIERNIGISKDYNNFELQKAIAEKNFLTANRIVRYFADNQKANPIFPTLSMLHTFFYNLLIIHYSNNHFTSKRTREKSPNTFIPTDKPLLASRIGMNPFFVDRFIDASDNYDALKCMKNMEIIEDFDAKCKGVGTNFTATELYPELIFKLMHDTKEL